MRITILNGEPDADERVRRLRPRLRRPARRQRPRRSPARPARPRPQGLLGMLGLLGQDAGRVREARRQRAGLPRGHRQRSDRLRLADARWASRRALLKRAADQMIPLVHPYIVIEGGEMHHRARYERYPLMGLLLARRRRHRRRGPRDHAAPVVAHGSQHEVVARVHDDRDRPRPAKEAADELAAVA